MHSKLQFRVSRSMTTKSPPMECIHFPVGHPRSGECMAQFEDAFAVAASAILDPTFPNEVGPGHLDGDQCLVMRVVPIPQGGMFVNLCHQDQPPFAIQDVDALVTGKRIRKIDKHACPRGKLPSVDLASGRLACADSMMDPCRRTLAATLGEDGEVMGYTCAPQSGVRLVENPCSAGSWLLPVGDTNTFECTNPCASGSVPQADGSGAYVCVPTMSPPQ
jgi:hypothetical protein